MVITKEVYRDKARIIKGKEKEGGGLLAHMKEHLMG
jgi:hypothetical protein